MAAYPRELIDVFSKVRLGGYVPTMCRVVGCTAGVQWNEEYLCTVCPEDGSQASPPALRASFKQLDSVWTITDNVRFENRDATPDRVETNMWLRDSMLATPGFSIPLPRTCLMPLSAAEIQALRTARRVEQEMTDLQVEQQHASIELRDVKVVRMRLPLQFEQFQFVIGQLFNLHRIRGRWSNPLKQYFQQLQAAGAEHFIYLSFGKRKLSVDASTGGGTPATMVAGPAAEQAEPELANVPGFDAEEWAAIRAAARGSEETTAGALPAAPSGTGYGETARVFYEKPLVDLFRDEQQGVIVAQDSVKVAVATIGGLRDSMTEDTIERFKYALQATGSWMIFCHRVEGLYSLKKAQIWQGVFFQEASAYQYRVLQELVQKHEKQGKMLSEGWGTADPTLGGLPAIVGGGGYALPEDAGKLATKELRRVFKEWLKQSEFSALRKLLQKSRRIRRAEILNRNLVYERFAQTTAAANHANLPSPPLFSSQCYHAIAKWFYTSAQRLQHSIDKESTLVDVPGVNSRFKPL